MKRSIFATSALLLAAAVTPATDVAAQNSPATQHVISRGFVSRPSATPKSVVRKASHVIFGRLESIQGKTLALRARSGHIWSVDASEAVASDNYSAPLFVGKIVEVDGYFTNSHVLQATGIMRMGTLDSSTPPDK